MLQHGMSIARSLALGTLGMALCLPASSLLAATTQVSPDSKVVRLSEPTQLKIDRSGVKVWTYQVAGNPSFNFKATTVLDSTLAGAVNLVLDLEHISSWVPFTRKVDLLQKQDENGNFVLRMELDFPFPLKDRDVVVAGQIRQLADGSVVINNRAIADNAAPERADFIRIKHYEGGWVFRPMGNGKVQVTATGFADPAGSLPLGIVNMFVQQQPYMMLHNMQTAVQASQYQQSRLTIPAEAIQH